MGRKSSVGIKVTPPKPLPWKPLGGPTTERQNAADKLLEDRLTTEGETPFEDVLDRMEMK
jgi:hypothetical protein